LILSESAKGEMAYGRADKFIHLFWVFEPLMLESAGMEDNPESQRKRTPNKRVRFTCPARQVTAPEPGATSK